MHTGPHSCTLRTGPLTVAHSVLVLFIYSPCAHQISLAQPLLIATSLSHRGIIFIEKNIVLNITHHEFKTANEIFIIITSKNLHSYRISRKYCAVFGKLLAIFFMPICIIQINYTLEQSNLRSTNFYELSNFYLVADSRQICITRHKKLA